MHVDTPHTCWALTSSYDVSVLQGAMGDWVLGTRGAAAAQRVSVSHLTGCVRVPQQHCAAWRASWILPHPRGNFPWNDHDSTTLHWVHGVRQAF